MGGIEHMQRKDKTEHCSGNNIGKRAAVTYSCKLLSLSLPPSSFSSSFPLFYILPLFFFLSLSIYLPLSFSLVDRQLFFCAFCLMAVRHLIPVLTY